jgi:hypothetical protein
MPIDHQYAPAVSAGMHGAAMDIIHRLFYVLSPSIQINPKSIKTGPSPAKPQPNSRKEKSLDFLGFPCPNCAFSMGYRDPQAKKFFSSSFPRSWPCANGELHPAA